MSDVYSGFDPIDDLIETFLERYRRGERPSLSEYADNYPQLAEQIRRLFPALVVIEELGPPGEEPGGPQPGEAGAQLELPKRVGDYRVLRTVGSGGMGVVYEAIQESLGRRVALKVLPFNHPADATRLERFRREARAAARLHHTHIVPVHGVGEDDGLHFYAMQFIRGQGLDAVLHEIQRLRNKSSPSYPAESLEHWLDSTILARGLHTGRFPEKDAAAAALAADVLGGTRTVPLRAAPRPDTPAPVVFDDRSALSCQSEAVYVSNVVRIGADVAEALEYAHQQGILHRDIKPANLLLDMQGHLWITDFGLAKAHDSDELTRTGDVVGTLKYMAPERFNGWSDPRSDVYSLGATLYEMLTLRPAYPESDRVKLIEHILRENPPPLRQLDRRIPRDLETVVQKALAKEPGERYPTAGRMAEDLRRFNAGRPILARRVTPIERLWRWSLRNKLLAGAAGAAALALVATAAISIVYASAQVRATKQIRGLAGELRAESERLAASLAESNRLLAIRNFDRGQAALEKDEIGPGLLWMLESWKSAIAGGDQAWQHAARAGIGAWAPHHPRLKAVLSHRSPADAAAFSPDGTIVATGGEDRVAQLWDTASGRRIGAPLAHGGAVFALEFSPDGKSLVTGSADKVVRFWDAHTGQPIGSPIALEGEVRAVLFSPDGKTVLTGSSDHTARLWDTACGRPVGPPLQHSGSVVALAFSPDGRSFLTADDDVNLVRRWDATTRRPLNPPMRHERPVWSAAFSADGKTIITGSHDGVAWLWNASDGALLRRLDRRHQGSVRAVAFSPDGKTILTGGTDKSAQLWDAATELPIGTAIRHQGPVVGVAFSPDGGSIATTSSDGTVRLWDCGPAHVCQPVMQHRSTVSAVAFRPGGMTIVTGSRDRTVRQWDTTTGRPMGKPLQHNYEVLALAVSPDGTAIATGCGSTTNSSLHGAAQLWNASTGERIGDPLAHHGAVTVVAFSPDGKILLTGGQDKTIQLWDAATGTLIGSPLPQPGAVDAGAFSPDGKTFLAAYDSGEARLWDVKTATPLDPPFPHPGAVSAVAFSPDGSTLLTGCEDNLARLWNVRRRTLRVPPLSNQGWVFGVAFSPDGETVCAVSRQLNHARLWHAATGMPLGPPMIHPSGITSVAFSPDGSILATGSHDGKARRFRMAPKLPDDLERIAAWIGVLTGLSLDGETGAIQVLDNAAWLDLREQLTREEKK